MLNDHERSVQKHPWSAKAHEPADLFTLFLLIAMHAAVAAEGLAFHKRTAVYALTLPDSTESTVSAMRMVVGLCDTRRIVLSFCA